MGDYAHSSAEHHRAIEQEYMALTGVTEPEDIKEATRLTLTKGLPAYVETLDRIARCAESEATQLSAIKFIYTILTDKETSDQDELRKLLKELNEPYEQSPTNT